MIETVVKVDGMMCGMCESHVNDAVRKAFPEAKKVASSHTKAQTVNRLWTRQSCGMSSTPPATKSRAYRVHRTRKKVFSRF